MHPPARETETAYKTGRSTTDILSIIQNQTQNEDNSQLIPIGRSKSPDSIDRNIIWAILYEAGLPWTFIQKIRDGGHGG